MKCVLFCFFIHFFVCLSLYTEQNYKRNTFVFAPIFHETLFYTQKAYFSNIVHKSV